jgi:hypothetical protein
MDWTGWMLILEKEKTKTGQFTDADIYFFIILLLAAAVALFASSILDNKK